MLPSPVRYFPISSGLYEVAPGLSKVLNQKGHEGRDAQIFQFDNEFHRYRENKIQCRSERLSKYLQTHEYSRALSSAVNRFLARYLALEHPAYFSLQENGAARTLLCHLSQEKILLNSEWELESFESPQAMASPYSSAFDALASQVQEDVAVMTQNEEGRDWLAALHLCSPSHWAAEEKIGKNFFDIHVPIPGIEKINRAATSFVEMMIHKGPFVRFVWGFATDKRLNHHPEAPQGKDPKEWKGRAFDKTKESPFILRLERQVLWGLPEAKASVFLIRTYFIDGEEIRRNPQERALLTSGLKSMSPESRVYKGVDACINEILAWLNE